MKKITETRDPTPVCRYIRKNETPPHHAPERAGPGLLGYPIA
jgi:hypothetical protein